MTTKRRLSTFILTFLVVSVPFALIHLAANPDDAPITPLQHFVALLANYFGPWGVAIVRVVDFPNAGLRSFSWGLALALTLIGVALLVLRLRLEKRPLQLLCNSLWALFALIWFGVGLVQIAAGLL